MKNFIKIVSVLISIVIFLQIYIFIANKQKRENSDPVVSVSTFALYDIGKHIAPKSIKLVNILPFGVDPHSFEPTPSLVADIEQSALVLYSGAGLEPWIHGFEFKNRVVNMSKYMSLRELDFKESDSHKDYDEEGAEHRLDPHYWLDFNNMQKATFIITDEFIKLNPTYKKRYIANRDKYIMMLKSLDKEYKKCFLICKRDTIVSNHNSMGYLSIKYNFNVKSLSGLSPESKPTIDDVKNIIDWIKSKKIKTIFFENFVNSKTIKSIAKDENISVEVFQALGNITADEAKKSLTYQDIMRDNLEKLSKALVCR